MICLKVRRLLPQYCSGELPEQARRRIQKHLDGCVQCSAERALFEDALAAIAIPAPMLETPAELEFLRLPEEAGRARTFGRPALAAALAGAAALALVLPSVRLANDPEELDRKPQVAAIPTSELPEVKPGAAPGVDTPVRAARKRVATAAVRTRPKAAPRVAGSQRTREADAGTPAQLTEQENPLIVVVSNPVEQTGVEIESFDIQSGKQTYFKSEPDESGGQRILEVSWDPGADVSAEGDQL